MNHLVVGRFFEHFLDHADEHAEFVVLRRGQPVLLAHRFGILLVSQGDEPAAQDLKLVAIVLTEDFCASSKAFVGGRVVARVLRDSSIRDPGFALGGVFISTPKQLIFFEDVTWSENRRRRRFSSRARE